MNWRAHHGEPSTARGRAASRVRTMRSAAWVVLAAATPWSTTSAIWSGVEGAGPVMPGWWAPKTRLRSTRAAVWGSVRSSSTCCSKTKVEPLEQHLVGAHDELGGTGGPRSAWAGGRRRAASPSVAQHHQDAHRRGWSPASGRRRAGSWRREVGAARAPSTGTPLAPGRIEHVLGHGVTAGRPCRRRRGRSSPRRRPGRAAISLGRGHRARLEDEREDGFDDRLASLVGRHRVARGVTPAD